MKKTEEVRKFTEEELRLLRSCQYSDSELAVLFDRSKDSIKQKRHNLKRKEAAQSNHRVCKNRYYQKFNGDERKNNYWSDEELKLIMNSRYTDSQLSQMLGRSVNSITVKRHRLKKEL